MQASPKGKGKQKCNRRSRTTEEKEEYHFFRIVSPSCIQNRRLGIPKKFISIFGKELANIVVLEVPSSEEWYVELREDEGQVWFQNGWHEFMEYYSICVWHSLIFQYKGDSRFTVVICDMSASEIWYPFEATTDMEDLNKDNEIPMSSKHKNKKEHCASDIGYNGISLSELGNDSNRTRSELKKEDDSSCQRNADPAIVTLQEFSQIKNEKVMSCPPGFERTRSSGMDLCHIKNREGPAESSPSFLYRNGFSNIERNTKKYKVVDSNSCFTELGSIIGGASAHPEKTQTELVFGPRRPVSSWEEGRGHVPSTINSGNPFCIVKMRSTYVFQHFKLTLPIGFARTCLNGKFNCVTLQVSDGRMWQVGCSRANQHFRLVRGWKKFVLDNHVEEADTLIFELVDKKRRKLKVVIVGRTETLAAFKSSDGNEFEVIENEEISILNKPDINDVLYCTSQCASLPEKSSNPSSTPSLVNRGNLSLINSMGSVQETGPCVLPTKRSRMLVDDRAGFEVFQSISENAGKGASSLFYCRKNSESDVTLITPISDGPCGMKNSEGPLEPSSSVFDKGVQSSVKVTDSDSQYNKKEIQEQIPKHAKQENEVAQMSSANHVKERSLIAARSFTSDYPFCSITMRHTYVNLPFNLNIPKDFADKYLKKAFQGITLVLQDRQTWHVQQSEVDHRKLSTGWRAFVRENHLKEDDICIFELVDQKRNVLKVSIFRRHPLVSC